MIFYQIDLFLKRLLCGRPPRPPQRPPRPPRPQSDFDGYNPELDYIQSLHRGLDGSTVFTIANPSGIRKVTMQFDPVENAWIEVDTEEKDILAVLGRIRDEIERRKGLYQDVGVDKIERYNLKSDEGLKRIAILVDEGTSLFEEPKICEVAEFLALRGRKFGVHLITAAPMWQVNNLSKKIRAPLATRVCFRVESESESRVILNGAGAESLSVPGRCLINIPGRLVTELQAPIVAEDYIEDAFENRAGPICEMPTGANLGQDLRITELARQGKSQRQIEKEVFGYTGGRAHSEVSRVLAIE